MSHEQVSRRGFFRRAAGATAAGSAQAFGKATKVIAQRPARAWTIVGLNWEYNDEFCFEAGELVEPKVYFDEQEAKSVCQKLCDVFFSQSPQDFEPCWEAYEGADPDTATWDDLRLAGFPDPYYVKELET